MERIIDLRSDTVTRPSPAMLQAMMNAPVGDDVFGDDPTVNELESKVAKMFNHEAAIFCSSGTQTNQIAIKVHTQPAEELICDRLAHIYNYEGGGIAFNSGVQVRYVFGDKGIFTPQDVFDNINPLGNPHFPNTTLVCIENTVNKGGGSVWSLAEMQAIREVCDANNLKLHLDGARLFNALAVTKNTTQEIGNVFHSVSICLSKGLGCPVGSVLTGSSEMIAKARRIRKVLGGGMRQAGFLAAAGLYALENNVDRLHEDHIRAKMLQAEISKLSFVDNCLEAFTNIVIFKTKAAVEDNRFLNYLEVKGIKAVSAGPHTFRFVTHLDLTDADLQRLIEVLKKFD